MSSNAADEIDRLSKRLDEAFRHTVAGLPQNTSLRIEEVGGNPDLVLSPLDKLEEPPSLTALRMAIDARLPRVDLPELVLEIHARTGFADAFRHASEAKARAQDLATSISAVLVSEACNTGLEPMIRPEVPALSRSRLGWVKQNYIRADTLTAANAMLVAAQNDIDLVQAWGSGEVASADGLRFVVPIRTIHSGPNPRYFGRERGVTYYNMTSDQYTGLNGVVVPGTLRDSLVLLSVVLEQETELKPVEIMTDTGAYTDAIFGIFYLLGFQFSPRLADAGGARLWRVDQKADYGPLNRLASDRINTRIITEQWDDLLRLAGSLKLGVVQASGLIRTLQTNNSPTRLARALAELGRIIKTVHLLNYFDDEAYRRRILVQLNRGEGRHMLSRAVFHGKRGELRQRYRQGPGGPAERTRPDRQRDRALEHDLHGRGAAAAPQGGLRGQGGGCCPPVAARARAHQHARPLRLLAARQDRTRRAAATQEPGSARRGGLKEALPSNSVPLLLGPLSPRHTMIQGKTCEQNCSR